MGEAGGGRRAGGCLLKDIYNKRIKLDFFLSFYMDWIISFGYINMGRLKRLTILRKCRFCNCCFVFTSVSSGRCVRCSGMLQIFHKLLLENEVNADDFVDQPVDVQVSEGPTLLNKPQGHTIMHHMMIQSPMLKKGWINVDLMT